MSTIVNASWECGDLGSKHDGGCVGVAGKGLPSAYYRAFGNISVKLEDDGSVWVNQTSLTVDQSGISNQSSTGGWASTDPWYFHGLFVSTSSFTLTDGPSGPSGYGNGVKVWSDGTIEHDKSGTPSSHYSYLSNSSSTGWQKLANSIDELSHNNSNEIVYVYIGGLIDFNATPTNSIDIEAVKVSVSSTSDPGISSLFEYFPWERYIQINNSLTWASLNRDGSKSTTSGLFRMAYTNNQFSWMPCTNRPGNTSTSNDHAFRYNGEEWEKSPKSGLGA